jgi:hypothetical protein
VHLLNPRLGDEAQLRALEQRLACALGLEIGDA